MTPSASSLRSVLAVAGIAVALQLVSLSAAEAQVAAPRDPTPATALNPVDAAVAEASQRFGVPEHWIRAVMRQESNGDVSAVSHAGAMGLMQVMPGTYAELRSRYGLGPDPFAIRNNVLAGTAYLRQMHDRYGRLGMLAAYNAGPGRWEAYRAGVRTLPAETVGYLARLGPVLDVGSLPAPALAALPMPPSPFASPLFVALSAQSAAVPLPDSAPSARVLLAATTPVAAPTETLFVRRRDDEPEPSSGPPPSPPSPAERTVEPSPPPQSEPSPEPSNSLFPPRPEGSQR